MAKRRGGYRGNPYNAKAYQFTARRRAALKKAQAKSARKRKITMGIMAVGGVAAVGTVAYMGRNTSVGKGVQRDVAKQVRKFSPQHVGRAANLKRARDAVNPGRKEAVRIAGAVSPAEIPGGYPAFVTAPVAAHVPGDPSTYKRTDLGKQDAGPIRTQLDNEKAWQEHMGIFEKYMDPGDKGTPRSLVNGKPITRSEFRKAVAAHNKQVVKSGGEAYSEENINRVLDRMVADGTLRTRVSGAKAQQRTNPQAVPKPVVANTGYTEEQHAAMLGFDVPLKPVLGIPTSKGGARGVVKLPGSDPSAQNLASSMFGTHVTGGAPGVSTPPASSPANMPSFISRPGQDAKPPEQPTTPAFSHAAPQAQPHAPSAARQANMISGYDPKSASGKEMRSAAQSLGLDISSRGHLHRPRPGNLGADEASEQDRKEFWDKIIPF